MSLMQALTTKVKRFACDRCHTQKLRCPRSAAESASEEPCVRCKKVGLACNISAAEKVGRPRRVSKLCERTKSSSGNDLPPSNEPTQDTSTASLRGYGAASAELKARDDTEMYRSTAKAPTSLASAQSLTSPSHGPFGDSDSPLVVDDFLNYFDFDMGFLETTNPHTIDQKSVPPSPLESIPDWDKPKQPTLPPTTTAGENPLSFWRIPASQTETAEQQPLFNNQSLDDSPTFWNTPVMNIESIPSTPIFESWTPAEEVILRGTKQIGRRTQTTMAAQKSKILDSSSDIEMDSSDNTWPTAASSFPFTSAAQIPTGTAKKVQQRRTNQIRQQPRHGATEAKGKARTIAVGVGEEEDENRRGEIEGTENLVQLQRDVLSCTRNMLHPSSIRGTTAPKSGPSLHPQDQQSRIKTLGKLFGATEKLISLIDSPSTMTGNSRSEVSTPSPEIEDSSSIPIYPNESLESMPTTYAVNGKKRRLLSKSASPRERESYFPQQNFSSVPPIDAREDNFDNTGEEATNLLTAAPNHQQTPASFHRHSYTGPRPTRTSTPISTPNSLPLTSDSHFSISSPLLKAYASLIDTLSNQLLHITTTAYNDNSSTSSSLSSSSAAAMNVDNNAGSLESCLQLQVLALQVACMRQAIRDTSSYGA